MKKKTPSKTAQMILDALENFDKSKDVSTISNTSFSFASDTVAREDITFNDDLDESDEFFGRLIYDGDSE